MNSGVKHDLAVVLGALGGIFMIAIVILNGFGGIISGVWLLFLGNWEIVFTGIAAALIMPWLFTLVSAPLLLLAPVLGRSAQKGRKKTVVFLAFMTSLYSDFLILTWVFLVFDAVVIQMLEQNVNHPILLTLFAYAVAISPLVYMSKEDRDSAATNLGIIMAIIWFGALVVAWFGGWWESVFISAVFWLLLVGTPGLISWIASDLVQETAHE